MHDNKFSIHSAATFRQRVVYDALAELNNNINKCDDIPSLRACINTSIKYIFDCVCVRFVFTGINNLQSVHVPKNDVIKKHFAGHLEAVELPFEKKVASTKIAQYILGLEDVQKAMGEYLPAELREEIDAIWTIPFPMQDKMLIVSVFSGITYRFSKTDLPLLKIICESFFARVRSLELLDEVTRSKNNLKSALDLLKMQNVKISQLVNSQEHTILQRTRQLQEMNNTLAKIIKFNAHNIREPLTRIFGLLEITKISTEKEIIEETLPLLHDSARDLDMAIKSIIIFLENNS